MDYVSHIRSDGAALAAAARKAGLDAAVPSCPEWKVADLVTHIAGVHGWVANLVRTRAQEFQPFPEITDDRDALVGVFEAGVARLADTLAEAGDDTTVWNFLAGAPEPSAWWHRRQAMETAIHRVDAELAAGLVPAVEAQLAADGIDEYLGFAPLFKPAMAGTVHLHTTDADGEWLITFTPDAPIGVAREHAKGDVALRGPASDLFQWVWNRLPTDTSSLEVFGDRALLDGWTEQLRF